jgi:hypothetical protein
MANAAGLALRKPSDKNAAMLAQMPALGSTASLAGRVEGTFAPAATATTTEASNLYAVSDSGQLTQAVSSGSAAVSQFFIAPNGDVYVLFSQPVNLDNTSSSGTCLLAQVDPATGVPACIDDTLKAIVWPAQASGGNPPIQFDSSGRIYYMGWTGGTMVLRRYSGGIHTDLITSGATLEDFVVVPDGSVILNGETTSTGAHWVRRVSPDGALQTLFSSEARSLSLFPDGNVYMGMWDVPGNQGVRRLLTATDTIDPTFWISDTGYTPSMNYNAGDFCPQAGEGFCGFFGIFLQQRFTTADGKEFAISGPSNGFVDRLMEYYPSVQVPTTAVQNAQVGTQVGDKIALAGLNAAGQNILTLYNPTTDSEQQLIGPDHEIEIYHLNYDSSQNALIFDGLRFSDNTYIVGKVDLATGAVTVGTTLNGQLQDLQTF